jgi:hypothetical protein
MCITCKKKSDNQRISQYLHTFKIKYIQYLRKYCKCAITFSLDDCHASFIINFSVIIYNNNVYQQLISCFHTRIFMSILIEFKFTQMSPLFFKNDFNNVFEVQQVNYYKLILLFTKSRNKLFPLTYKTSANNIFNTLAYIPCI